MSDYTKTDMEEARLAIASMISRTEKAKAKFAQGTSQHTLLANRLEALTIASSFVFKELAASNDSDHYTKENLEKALAPIASLISKSEKALSKVAQGTWQHTMLSNNLKALYIASPLLTKALSEIENHLYEPWRIPMKNLTIRNETPNDHFTVEEMTREAFWNLYVPGCDEHYLVHIMRDHEDFIPELDFVAEMDGMIVGNIMYTKAALIGEAGNEKPILTFGPLCVRPGCQRKGIGKELLQVSFDKALDMGYDTIVIFGNPANYVARGFRSCIRFNVCMEGGVFPSAMMVKELKPGVFDGRRWVYRDSPVYHYDQSKVEEYDQRFPAKHKESRPHQEEFFIHTHSTLTSDSTIV